MEAINATNRSEHPLVRLLHVLDELWVSRSWLCAAYGLRPNTLSNIAAGHVPSRNLEKYTQAFIDALNQERRQAASKGDVEKERQIMYFLGEVLLCEHGII